MKSILAYTQVTCYAAILLMSGCTASGPQYSLPSQSVAQRPAAAAPFLAAGETVYRSTPLPDNWWQLYDEPVMNALIQEALNANADLKVAAANLARTRAVEKETADATTPTIGLSAAPSAGRASAAARGLPNALPDSWSYDSTVSVSYQADLFGKIARATEAANADTQAAQAGYDLVRISVVADTARAYTEACSAMRQITIGQQSIDLQKKTTDLIAKRIQLGRGTETDHTRSLAQLALLQSTLPQYQSQQRVAYYKLAVLTGKTPQEMNLNQPQCHDVPRLTSPLPLGDGAALLRRRPDIRQAERNLAAATARIGVSIADLYPHVSFGISAGSSGLLDHFGAGNAFHWNLGPLISWSFPSAGARSRVSAAEASAEGALAHFDAVVLNALKEAESALIIYAREKDRNAALQTARDESVRAAQQIRHLFESGRTDFLSVLDADRSATSSEAALAASDAQLTNDQISLFLALGGGNAQPGITHQ